MTKLISFCIPTLENHDYISQTIESIINQSKINDVEIIIGDSNKNNKTKVIIDFYRTKFSSIVYKKLNKNIGFDSDLEETISLANGKYCWLLSSDDVLIPGAIDIMKKELIKNKEVYLFNRLICSKNLQKKYKSNKWLSINKNKNFSFSNKNTLLKYLNLGTSIGCIFSYMSCIVIKKKNWNEDFIKTNYLIKKNLLPTGYFAAFKILSILTKNSRIIRYLKYDLIYFRGDNDSFKKNGYVNRINIDFNGYRKICNFFFKEKFLKDALFLLMQKEHKFFYLLRYRNECLITFNWSEQKKNLIFYNYPKWQIFFIELFGQFSLLVKILRFFKKFYK